MSKAKRNRILKAAAEHKGDARKQRRNRWKRLFPVTKHESMMHPRVYAMPLNISPEEWARMVKRQNETRDSS